MPKARILGMSWAKGLENLSFDAYGISPQRIGDEFVFSEADLAKIKIHDVLDRHHEADISDPANDEQVAKKMVTQIATDFPPTLKAGLDEIEILGGFGNLTKLDEYNARIAVDVDAVIPLLLKNDIIPYAREQFVSQRVLGVTAKVTYCQTLITLSKMIGIAAHKTFEAATEAIIDKKSGATIFPFGDMPLKYLACLTIASPFAISLPFERRGTAWHFYGSGRIFVKSASVSEGLFRSFLDKGSIRTDKPLVTSFLHLDIFSTDDVWALHKHYIIGINNIFRFISDPRNFLVGNVIDFRQMARCFAALNLIFADLANMQSSSDPHSTFTFAFSLLDKLANLKVHFANNSAENSIHVEAVAMKNMLSQKQAELIISIIENQFADQKGNAGSALKDMVYKCYETIKSTLHERTLGDEDATLTLLRDMRNLQHGIFSSGKNERFLKLYDGATGAVPDSLPGIVYLLLLALLFDPNRFLTGD